MRPVDAVQLASAKIMDDIRILRVAKGPCHEAILVVASGYLLVGSGLPCGGIRTRDRSSVYWNARQSRLHLRGSNGGNVAPYCPDRYGKRAWCYPRRGL